MRNTRIPNLVWSIVGLTGVIAANGCHQAPVDTSEFERGPAPLRMPSPAKGECESYEDSLTGGKVFSMYCSYCHNAPSLAERNFANFRNVAAHMRVRANLTGTEYAKLMEFFRQWNDVPPPTPSDGPTPKRFYFSQPIPELKDQTPTPVGPPVPQPQPKQS